MATFADPYAYPGSTVLVNKPGFRNEQQLKQFEYEASAMRLGQLAEKPVPGKFDLAHLKRIHAHVFQDVYPWAGDVRTVGISKGSTTFARPEHIESYGAALGKGLAKENFLRGLEKPAFVERLSYFYTEFNALHPFREGNGRATREFIGQLAREAGYTLDQARIDNDKGRWNDAAARSFKGDIKPIEAFFAEAVRPSRSIAFERLGEAEALAKHPELKGGFDALRALDVALRERFPDNGPARDRYLSHARAETIARLDQGAVIPVLQRTTPTIAREPHQGYGR